MKSKSIKTIFISGVLLITVLIVGFTLQSDPWSVNSTHDATIHSVPLVETDLVPPPAMQPSDLVCTNGWLVQTNSTTNGYGVAGAYWLKTGGPVDTPYYVLWGGNTNGSTGASDVVRMFNTISGTWTEFASTANPRFIGGGCVVGDTFYFGGGLNSSSIYTNTWTAFNLRTGVRTLKANLPVLIGWFQPVAAKGRYIYICGGYNGANVTTTHVYDTWSNTWATGTSGSYTGYLQYGAAIICDSIIVRIGGAGVSTTAEVYEGVINATTPTTITWTTGANYPVSTGVYKPAVGSHPTSKWVYCIGGCIGPSFQTSVTNSYRYNPYTNTWQTLPNRLTATGWTNAAVVRDDNFQVRVYTANGQFNQFSPPYANHERLCLYDTTLAPPAQLLCEQFASTTFPPTDWSLVYTGTLYWTRETVSGFGLGTGSAKFNFYSASAGTNQGLLSANFTPTVTTDSLRITHAYATYETENDQLQIQTSTNGGTSWTTLVTLNGGVSGPLVTAPPQTAAFTPTASQWAKKVFGLPVGTNKVRFNAISAYGNNLYLDSICVGPNFLGITPVGIVPGEFSLSQNYPNPFNPSTVISFALPKASDVKLVVFDLLGREVTTLVNDFRTAGNHSVEFNAANFASGIYFYRIEAGNFTATKKMLLIK